MKTEALKLADELEEFYVDPDGFPYLICESVTMIRRLVEELDCANDYIKQYQLEKQGEPVVYWDGKHFASKEKSNLADIPLYTAPQTKPLSDEEIEEIINKHWNREYGNRNMLTLCRAIEAKVRGEK